MQRIPYNFIRRDGQGYAAYSKQSRGSIAYVIILETIEGGETVQKFYHVNYDTAKGRDINAEFAQLWVQRNSLEYSYEVPPYFFPDAPTEGRGAQVIAQPDRNLKCYAFNGVDEYITLGNSLPILQRTQAWTLGVWFKTSDQHANLLAKGRSYTNASSTQASLYVRYGKLEGIVGGRKVTSNVRVANDEWQLATLRNQPDGKFTLHLNGYPLGSASRGSYQDSLDILIGAKRRDTSNSRVRDLFDGLLDDIVYFDQALTEVELAELYNTGIYRSPLKHSQANHLKLWLNADQDLASFPIVGNHAPNGPEISAAFVNGYLTENLKNR